ncbi:MAG: PilW family protein [Proteobacteria bacterium]|nr:PilW family protein [Pseudomonadota bacterium]
MKNHLSKGFNLLEWLVASFISAMVIAGLTSVYLGIKNTYVRHQVVIDLQESARFALSFLNLRIRVAGYVGCQYPQNPIASDAVTGYDSNSALPPALQDQVIKGTDALVITSCVSNSQLSENTQLISMAYFIGDTNRKNSLGMPILALFQKPLDGDRVELVPGVEQMHILYGVKNETEGVLDYFSASQVTDWQKVIGMQIDLTINSIEPVFTKNNGVQDLLLHKNWSTYITLRERLP